MRLRSQKYQASYLQKLVLLVAVLFQVSILESKPLNYELWFYDEILNISKQGLPIHELSAIELPTAK
ncbi:Uncharacterised protein [Acinetobacter baumannii]|nr:Uncharacterised protein [Acinetobacter baumannii]SSS40865.1 Uncharacterised protein [Acinetobacter baumannii]SST14672.1 Uncharacterised protein [Acinetobacter baumannii]SSU24574.1 Uncharacterised protein [Acinetobacter baumannii]SSU46932.1 Uncharacterised protein [Acinetobacter baumannii]